MIQNCTAVMRMIAHEIEADSVDEYARMGASDALECLERFCTGVVQCFKHEYPLPPNEKKSKIVLQRGDAFGLPGMLGSIDFCKWK